MGVPDRCRAERELAVEDLDLFIDDIAGGAGHGYLGAVEADVAHIHRELLTTRLDDDSDHAAGRVHGERVGADLLLVVKVAGENAQTVARFLSLGAIRVEDSEAELGPGGRQRTPEDAVGTGAEIAVTDDAGLLRGGDGPAREIGRVHHDVIIA